MFIPLFCSTLPGVKANAKIRRDNRFNGPAYTLYTRRTTTLAPIHNILRVVSSINLLCEEKIYFDSPSSYLVLLPNDGKSIQDLPFLPPYTINILIRISNDCHEIYGSTLAG